MSKKKYINPDIEITFFTIEKDIMTIIGDGNVDGPGDVEKFESGLVEDDEFDFDNL